MYIVIHTYTSTWHPFLSLHFSCFIVLLLCSTAELNDQTSGI